MASRRTYRAVLISGAATGLSLTLGLLPAAAAAPPTADNFHKLRVCESSDNYQADTGNGYYGAYQFDVPTWQGMGYAGRPDQADPATQDQAAQRLYDQRGWQPWPGCASAEGLD